MGLLQDKITEQLPTVINPSARKHLEKELVKTRIATQFIGVGAENSSTERYRLLYERYGVANTGKYTSNDIIWVSSNGQRRNRISPVRQGMLQGMYAYVLTAISAGATFVMDTKGHLEKTARYNVGEIALANYLKNHGYQREGESGIWTPIN